MLWGMLLFYLNDLEVFYLEKVIFFLSKSSLLTGNESSVSTNEQQMAKPKCQVLRVK